MRKLDKRVHEMREKLDAASTEGASRKSSKATVFSFYAMGTGGSFPGGEAAGT
jgi:hypothetical protein